MERNERLKAADKCASRYTNDNEARIAKKAFMLGCEFEAQGEVVKGVVLDTLQEPEVDLDDEIERRYDQAKWGYVDGFGSVCMDKVQFTRIARHFYDLGLQNAK